MAVARLAARLLPRLTVARLRRARLALRLTITRLLLLLRLTVATLLRGLLARPLASYYLLLSSSGLLLVIGLTMVFSATSVEAYATNGNAFTAAIVEDQIRMLLPLVSARAPRPRIAIVGASGSVGTAVTRLIARDPAGARLTLIARRA